jgi:two-component system response regulator AtoC
MVKTREFREDLYYRLNVVRIVLPALRERREDIAPMVRHFCSLSAAANNRSRSFAEDALAVFESSPWRGNVRQLQNFVERLVVLSEHQRITRADVVSELQREEGPLNDESTSDLSVIELDAAVRAAERRALEKALKKAEGNRVLAARLLGVSRRTLFYKLRIHGIT